MAKQREELGTEFWEGDATKQRSVKRSASSLHEAKALNEGFGKEFEITNFSGQICSAEAGSFQRGGLGNSQSFVACAHRIQLLRFASHLEWSTRKPRRQCF